MAKTNLIVCCVSGTHTIYLPNIFLIFEYVTSFSRILNDKIQGLNGPRHILISVLCSVNPSSCHSLTLTCGKILPPFHLKRFASKLRNKRVIKQKFIKPKRGAEASAQLENSSSKTASCRADQQRAKETATVVAILLHPSEERDGMVSRSHRSMFQIN
jgi:hypothetical protein